MLLMLAAIVAVVVGGAILLLSAVCNAPMERLWSDPVRTRRRLREIGPYALLLLVALAANKGLQGVITELSATVAFQATETIYQIEGDLVRTIQTTIPEETTLFFSAVYVFGYVTLLVFPVLAYFVAESIYSLKLLLSAYGLNYAGGVVCYTFVVAYGPRTLIPGVDHLLVDLYPQVTTLTSQVNRAQNVFPSLHTSLSVTVVLLAILTRDEYPRWFVIASALGSSIVLSTMYLGIHWGVDVLAGILLATASVYGAIELVDRLDSPATPGQPSGAPRASESD